MQQLKNEVEIGMKRGGEFNDPADAPEEIEAIEKVMGGVEEGLGQLVTAARAACPSPNCCLSAQAFTDSAEGGAWDEHPMNDTSYTVDFTRVEVGSKGLSDCSERADQLTGAIASMVERCIGATEEAKSARREKTGAAARKAKDATNTASVKKARETISKARETISAAEEKAATIRAGGKAEAIEAQDAVYARVKEEIAASFSEAPA